MSKSFAGPSFPVTVTIYGESKFLLEYTVFGLEETLSSRESTSSLNAISCWFDVFCTEICFGSFITFSTTGIYSSIIVAEESVFSTTFVVAHDARIERLAPINNNSVIFAFFIFFFHMESGTPPNF